MTNFLTPQIDGCNILNIGPDETWSKNLKKALSRLREDYVLLLLDDFMLVADVDDRKVTALAKWAQDNAVDCLRLSPGHPKPTEVINQEIGHVDERALYRTSLRFPLWNRKALITMLQDDENAWQFEIFGSERARWKKQYYCVYNEIFRYENCIIKGKWYPPAVRAVRKQGVVINLGGRAIMNKWECMKESARRIRSSILRIFPQALRGRVRRMLKRSEYLT